MRGARKRSIAFRRRGNCVRFWRWLALAVLSATSTALQGQEATRMSLASAEAAEARRRAAATIGYYNLKVGPTAWRFGAGLGVQYDDNVLLQENDQKGDVIFRPEVHAQMLWPVTEKNALNLNAGVGYSAYVKHPELSRLYVTPGSELSFDVYVGDFWINVHDRFSINQQSYQDPTVVGSGNYARLENALGLAGTWDLNKVLLRGGYDHVTYIALSGSAGQPDGEAELASASAGYALKPGLMSGLELGGGLLHYSGGTNVLFQDAKQWNAGVFVDTQVSEYMHFHGSVGYTDYAPENNRVPKVTGDLTGVYAQIELKHRVNKFVEYALTGGRSISFAYYGGSVDLAFARLQSDWRVVRKVTIGTWLQYDHGSQAAVVGEVFDRYGGGFTLGRAITAKLSGSAGYQFYWRTSNLPGRNYTDNLVSLNFNYTF